MSGKILAGALAMAVGISAPLSVQANDWINPAGGSFADKANWLGGVPSATQDARFNLGGAYPVSFDASPENANLVVEAGDIAFESISPTRSYSLTGDATIETGSLALGSSIPGTGISLSVGNQLMVREAGSFTAQQGSDVTVGAQLLAGDGNGAGAYVFDGAGTTLAVSGATNLGAGGNVGSLTLRNGASAAFSGALGLADQTSAPNSAGVVSVESGGALTATDIRIAPYAIGGQTGAFNVGNGIGVSTVTQQGDATLVVGGSLAAGTPNSGVLNINDGGVFNTGAGTTTVNATGSINIGGRLQVNGDMNVDGGSITRTNNFSRFNLAAGRTLTASNNAQIDLAGGLNAELSAGTTWNIQTGADMFRDTFMDIGVGPGVTTVTVDGAGSSLSTVGISDSYWGDVGGTAEVTVRNGASATFGFIELARASTAGTTGVLAVESGATMTTNGLEVAARGGASTTGAITVTGDGSTLTQTGNSPLTLGHASSGAAALNVLDGATFSTGAGATAVHATGSLTIDGGTLNLNGLIVGAGALNFTSGQLNVNDSRPTVSVSESGQRIGGVSLDPSSTLTLGSNRGLSVAGVTRIDAGGTLELAGGSLDSGTLLIQPGASLVSATASNTAAAAILALAGSTIDAGGGDLALGNASLINGFGSAGTLRTGDNTVTLLDANDAVFDSLALLTLGDAGGPGALAAANGLTLDFGGNIAGHGAIETPDDPARPFINNGNVIGNSLAQPLTLSGYVKGVGNLDNVEFSGTFSPGFSPASVNLGSAVYDGRLQIEIAGLAPGSGHDQLNHILAGGVAQLGGALEVSLLGGFSPAVGDAFEIITAGGGVNGTFASAILPALAAGLGWNLSYEPNAVTLSVVPAFTADFDLDSDVDGADLVEWQGDFGVNDFSDADADGDSDGLDFLAWQRQVGGGPGAVSSSTTASAAVPEPATLLLALPGVAAAIAGRRRTKRR